MAALVVGCLARNPYSEMACSHWIHRDTAMAYWLMSWGLTSFSQCRAFSHSQVSR